jgi:hypothetical protein
MGTGAHSTRFTSPTPRRLASAVVLALAVLPAAMAAQAVSEENRVKAAYLYNFLKYVEWPPGATAGPLVICVAGRNPFGTTLADLVRGETINGRRIEARIILEPETGCHLLFVPEGAAMRAYLRGASDLPVLTVGESPAFVEEGGIAYFYLDRGNVRFAINPAAAQRARLHISARLLQLARLVGPEIRPE